MAPRDHAMPQGLTPTVFVMVNPMKPVSDAARAQGRGLRERADDFRWQKAHIKTTSLLGAVLARQISVEAGAAETIMFRDDWLSEASSSNVWVVKDGMRRRPAQGRTGAGRHPLRPDRAALRRRRHPLRAAPRSRATRSFGADELLLSSASKEVLPVTTLDGQAIGSGRPGPIYQALYAGYQQAKATQPRTDAPRVHRMSTIRHLLPTRRSTRARNR